MLKIELNYKFEPVEIAGEKYEIRELNGYDYERYEDKQKELCEFEYSTDSNGRLELKPKGIKPSAGNESFLISLCLYKSVKDGFERVEQDVIKQWPYPAQKALFVECEKFNKLGVYGKDLEKN